MANSARTPGTIAMYRGSWVTSGTNSGLALQRGRPHDALPGPDAQARGHGAPS